MKNRAALVLLGILWLGAVGIGIGKLWVYQDTPGGAEPSSASWPARSRLARVSGRATLVLFAHPKCPCSRASIGELARIMVGREEKLTAHVIFLKPEALPEDWTHTDLWRSALSIPGVSVEIDRNGAEAREFGARTSGHTFLYDPQGNLRFSGGITASRGHWGDNAGSAAIASFVSSGTAVTAATPVFGCSLREPSS